MTQNLSNAQFAEHVKRERRVHGHGWALWEGTIWHTVEHRLLYLYLIFPSTTAREDVQAAAAAAAIEPTYAAFSLFPLR